MSIRQTSDIPATLAGADRAIVITHTPALLAMLGNDDGIVDYKLNALLDCYRARNGRHEIVKGMDADAESAFIAAKKIGILAEPTHVRQAWPESHFIHTDVTMATTSAKGLVDIVLDVFLEGVRITQVYARIDDIGFDQVFSRWMNWAREDVAGLAKAA